MAKTEGETLKRRTARTLKWNTIDRISSQVVYAVVGVVLANILSKEDFGLVGAILVFQAFAILFVDSGFGAALLQKKNPDDNDYSTVFWFNLVLSCAIYGILWLAAPLIADIFHDVRLIPLSRVMFLTFIISGVGIVQTNRLMKAMDVSQIAISNVAGIIVGGIVGVVLAVRGYGAWSLVWQSIVIAAVKTGWIWVVGHWRPKAIFSRESLKTIWRVGLGVFSSSLLNTLFLNIYSFVIGAWYSLSSLGVYTQADKWSKMGSASLSQIMTASFVPLLSRFQDDKQEFRRYMQRINRFASALVFPLMVGVALVATPLFHTLFGNKWDAAIVLFQILMLRGIFVILISLYNNYLLSLGYAKSLVIIETVKDVATLAAILLTVFSKSLEMLVWGQFWASAVTWVYVLLRTCRCTGYRRRQMILDMMPFMALTLVAVLPLLFINSLGWSAPLLLIADMGVCVLLYVALLWLFGIPELKEAVSYLLSRRRKQETEVSSQ